MLTGKRRTCNSHIRWKDGVGNKADFGMGTPRLNQARTGLRIVDQVGALQMESAGSQIADFDGVSNFPVAFQARRSTAGCIVPARATAER